jgi:clan AA aspartic protease (TIGR02281 family)
VVQWYQRGFESIPDGGNSFSSCGTLNQVYQKRPLTAIDIFFCEEYNFFDLTVGSERMKHVALFILILIILPLAGYGEMYKWVDEKGTVHFADDLSNIPEKYRPDVEMRTPPQEISIPENKEKTAPLLTPKTSEREGFEVALFRRGELWMAEVLLNGRVKRHLIVDSGASFSLISRETAKELGLTIDENTPFIPGATVSGFILTPLVTLESVRVGNAEVRNVETTIYTMPSGTDGLLGNSFLNKFKVVLDSMNGKMTLFSMQGEPSPDRPGGYKRDYWVAQFRFYQRNLEDLRRLKAKIESQGARGELIRVNNAIRYFENQLSELDRRASFAGVPRNWRE